MTKFLIIRFSSIGDVAQCMTAIDDILHRFPDAEIHWITRKDMAPLLHADRRVRVVWEFDRESGARGLLRVARQLGAEHFDYLYDAHCNIRSRILKAALLSPLKVLSGRAPRRVTRHKERWKRLLLFRLGINLFDKPFKGADSYRKPLREWGVTRFDGPPAPWHFPPDFAARLDGHVRETTITLVPSANWELKRWPVARWRELVLLLPGYRFLLLAGPGDAFCEEIRAVAPERVTNLAGRTSLLESCYLVKASRLVIGADTGLLHVADLFRVPCLALMGPTAFGFPAGPRAGIIEMDLPCRPCTKDGRGRCKRPRSCMEEITAGVVAARAVALFPDTTA
ncbi:MAG: glycosyltransferase family 9 protein [Odoribacteraceae bacterium]|jgi:heptosyltransferase-2|nr:glycosyltransferase family 9 protein [Odoribacteraceae bacterium]